MRILCKREKEDDIRRVHEMRVRGKRDRGHPKHGWQNAIRKNFQSCSVNEEDAPDRVKLSSRIELGLWQPLTTRTGQSGDR